MFWQLFGFGSFVCFTAFFVSQMITLSAQVSFLLVFVFFLWVPCTFSLSLTMQSDEMEVKLLKAILDGVDHPWMGLTKASR